MRLRYSFRLDLEVPGSSAADAVERALRLFRPRVRAQLRQTVAYQGAYRGSWFSMSRLDAPPKGRVDLKKRRRKLPIPGPWRLVHENAEGAWDVWGTIEENGRKRDLVVCTRSDWSQRVALSEANGRLVAAAPEMAKALEFTLVQAMRAPGGVCRLCAEPYECSDLCAVPRMRAALAKAGIK